jgi:threonine/homoserine/homoserine lactone efflux protein
MARGRAVRPSGEMPDLPTLALFSLASLALVAVPGPSVLYVVTRSVSQGRRAGLVSMLGIEAGGLVHVAAAALGLSALLASSATAFTVVKYAGAAYLILLGLRKLAAGEELEVGTARRASQSRLFWEGALVNVLNPKTALFFLAFLPQFVEPVGSPVAIQVVALGVLFTAIAAISDSAYALAAGTAGAWLRSRWRSRSWLERGSGGVLVALGISTALSERPART